MPEPSLKEKTAKGLFWGAINNGAQQVLVLLFGIILARILSPDEYGMVGMLTIFTLIGNSLQESGFRAALVNVRNIRHDARFYQEPELTPLARYCFLAIPIASLGTAQGAYLFRNLKVRQQALSGIIAHVVSGCLGITLAFCGFSYWGIATQSLTYLITVTLCTWYFSPWRPTFRIDFRNQLNNNLLSVILGKYFNPQAVGNYNQANKWNGTGHQFITGMMGSVAQPVLASINDDRERSLRVFRKILRFCAFLAFPAMFGLSIVTHELILITVGGKWTGSIPLMQLLCIGGAFIPLNTLFSNLIISQRKSNIYMWNIIAQVVLQLATVLTIVRFGGSIHTMVITGVCINILWLFVWQRFARRFIRLSLRMLLLDIAPFLLTALIACASGWVVSEWTGGPLLVTFLTKIITAAACYFLIMKLAHAEILQECINYFFKKKRP